ncbi:MAG: Thivi_2564 family membrane protein [Bacteroidota bacterium]
MPLLTIIIVLIVAGILLWLVNTYIPMDHKIKTILNVVVVVILVVWLLKVFGMFSYLTNIHV